MDFYNTHRPNIPVESMDNSLITKFFERPQHAAHELRARNEQVQTYISQKWALSSPKVKSIEKPNDNYIEKRNQKEAQIQMEREISRKKKEYEVARVLDMQVEQHRTSKQIDVVKDRQIGQEVADDARQWHEQQEKAKRDRLERNKKHKEELEQLIQQRAKI